MQTRRYSTTETIMGLLVMAAVVIGIFILFRTIYGILKWATPFIGSGCHHQLQSGR